MIEFVPIDITLHKNKLVELNTQYLSWIAEQLMEYYSIDLISILGKSIHQYAIESVDKFVSFLPPEGFYYILQVEGKIAGMGALRKLYDNIGEIKRMYIKPEYRGKGLGKVMLKKLLKRGSEYGYSLIRLDTGPFMTAAQHIYCLAGFKVRDEYPESEVPQEFRDIWLYMEKKVHVNNR